MNGHNSFICNSKKLVANRMPIYWQIGKQIV